MTTAAWALLGIAAVLASGDWLAVAAGRTRLEYVCKPGATAALVGLAVSLDPRYSDQRAWFVAALVLSLSGDVSLMLPGDHFVPGLGSFLAAHVAYTVGFALHPGSIGEYVVGGLLVAVVGVPLLQRFTHALARAGSDALVVPVRAYFVSIGAMVVSAIASGNAWAVVGAALFLVSDSLIGETRFVGPRRHAPVTIMVTYHLAQAALVVSLVR